jgi:site-specific DNA recombinase
MGKLDDLVIDHLVERLLHPEALAKMLALLNGRCGEKTQALNGRIVNPQREATEAEHRLKRLYRLIEEGVTDLDDGLKSCLTNLKAERDRAKTAPERAGSQVAPGMLIDPALIEGGGRLMRHALARRNPERDCRG